jgi:hypothetical protein
VLPSSHCSPDWTKPSPHAGIVVLVVDVLVAVVMVVVVVVVVVEVVGIVLVVVVVGIVLLVEVVGTVVVEVVGAVVVVDGIIVVLLLVVVVVGHGPTRGRHLRMSVSASIRGRVPETALARIVARSWPGAFLPLGRTLTATILRSMVEQTLPSSTVGGRSWMRAGLKRARTLVSALAGVQPPRPG